VIQQKVNIISISWGTTDDVPSITAALNRAIENNILIFASASNDGANFDITFPARLRGVFCIGSADGKGHPSSFNPPKEGPEKYSALGEAVLGACPKNLSDQPGYDPETQTIRRDGTSTATAIAAGIAALFIDYTGERRRDSTDENIRKLFARMSKMTVKKDYRYLAPWSLFQGKDPYNEIKTIMENPLGN
jgi:subtilisin family serine protease